MHKLDTDIDLQLANDKWSARFTKNIPAGDWDINGRFYVENKCSKEWKYEAAVETQSPDLGGFKLNANVSAELDKQKSDGKGGAWKVEEKQVDFDVCAQIDNDYYVGAACAVQVQDKSVGDYKIGAGANMDDNNFWANYNVGEKQAKAGCQIKNKDIGFTHAYELKHYGGED
jgi:hypothetical protein